MANAMSIGKLGMNAGSAGLGIAAGIINAGIIRENGKIMQQRADFNSKMSNMKADRLEEATEERIDDYMKGVGKLIGRQRTSAAAQGVKVGTGVSRRIEVETRSKARDNIIRMEAAAGYQIRALRGEADQSILAGQIAKQKADSAATMMSVNAVLGGAASMGGMVADAASEGAFNDSAGMVNEINQRLQSSSGNSMQPLPDYNYSPSSEYAADMAAREVNSAHIGGIEMTINDLFSIVEDGTGWGP